MQYPIDVQLTVHGTPAEVAGAISAQLTSTGTWERVAGASGWKARFTQPGATTRTLTYQDGPGAAGRLGFSSVNSETGVQHELVFDMVQRGRHVAVHVTGSAQHLMPKAQYEAFLRHVVRQADQGFRASLARALRAELVGDGAGIA